MAAADSQLTDAPKKLFPIYYRVRLLASGAWATVSRIDKVRSALTKVLPSITRFRRVGLITYGPGLSFPKIPSG